ASGRAPGSETLEAIPKDIRAYGERSRFETASRWPLQPKDWRDEWRKGWPLSIYAPGNSPLQDLLGGVITPSGSHYFIDASAPYPLADIDPRQHRIMIHGMVDRPLILTMEELKLLPSVSKIHFLQCVVGWVKERNHLEFH